MPKRAPIIEGDTVRLMLTRGKAALIDAVDADLALLNWCASPCRHKWYASHVSRPRRRTVYLHREIAARFCGDISDKEIDHVDGDGLNCRRSNLRPCTRGQNLCNRGKQKNNSSGFKGVFRYRKNGQWFAQIRVSGRVVRLGSFPSPGLASEAYQRAASFYHGEFAFKSTPQAGEKAEA